MKRLILMFVFIFLVFMSINAKTLNSKRFVITIQISQSHITLDLWEHIKDSANKIKIEIPVDEKFYNSVKIGTILNNSFRTGSLILKGSFGSWDVEIINKKEIVE
jgi:hypothetical protein